MADWQPIETAPHRTIDTLNDSYALVYGPEIGIRIAARFGRLPWGDIAGSVAGLGGGLRDWNATHWMPLPAPPRLPGEPEER